MAGILPERVRMGAILFAGALGGASATLDLAKARTAADGMPAGRGFVAIPVVPGRWHPVRAAVAARLSGAASARHFHFQETGWREPYRLPMAIPYLPTLAALAARAPFRGRAVEGAQPPPALGR